MVRKGLWLIVVVSLVGSVAWAQNSDRPQRAARNETPARVPAIAAVTPTRASAPVANAAPAQNPGTPTAGMGGVVSSPSGYGSIPVQSYGQDLGFSIGGWYRCNYFVEQLMRDYRFLPGRDYLWRYAQGDSPLTPEALAFALKSSSAASRSLTLSAGHLAHVIASYERGEIDRVRFNQELRTTTRQIRDMAKRIRKDYYLEYVDYGTDRNVPDYTEASSLAELKELSSQLLESARGIDGTLDRFVHRDLSRVVSVKDLQGPSTDSLSKQIDQLAKVIQKSGTSL